MKSAFYGATALVLALLLDVGPLQAQEHTHGHDHAAVKTADPATGDHGAKHDMKACMERHQAQRSPWTI